jgi:para-nitrobenzyl esterase
MTLTRRVIRKSGSRLLCATGVAFALAGLGAGNALAAAQGAARPAAAQAAAGRPGAQPLPLVAGTDKGTVRGMYAGNAREFLGIPFAAPPVGALRWRPPQPASPWAGVRDATKPGSTCAQTGSIATGVPATSTAEDCLYLNVYAPRTAGHRPLPVMVWIHGGGLTGGAGSIYDGSVLAPKGGVIVVTINYRLSAFGFLALPSLDNEGASGDYGLMDQQAALRWVQRNARAFGGNPRNVTIFGESAGGASVCANMASPAAAGLFSRAIAESGCLLPAPSRQAAQQQGSALAASLGCTDPATAAACLRTKPAASILQAENGMSWAPVASTPVLPLQPAQAFATGRYDHVPLLQGTNHDEGRFFAALGFDALGKPLTAAQYPAVIQAAYGANAPAVLARYPLSAYPSPDLAYAQVFTDSVFSCPALEADNLTAGSGVYAYEFSDPSPPNDFGLTFSFPLGAAHSTELQYVFGKIPGLGTTPPFTAAQLALSDQMISYWSRFAATGNPNTGPDGGTTPHWPRFSAVRPAIQELVPDGTAPEPAAQFAAAHQCAFWAGMGAGVSSRPRSAAAG